MNEEDPRRIENFHSNILFFLRAIMIATIMIMRHHIGCTTIAILCPLRTLDITVNNVCKTTVLMSSLRLQNMIGFKALLRKVKTEQYLNAW